MVRIILLMCALSAGDRAWMDAAIDAWRTTARDALRVPSTALPDMILFDEACTWNANASAGTPHRGRVPLPDGKEIAAQVTSFASMHDGRPFFVMALPSVWRRDPRHGDEARVDALTRSVFIHEMTHTVQSQSLGARIGEVIERYGMPTDEVDDDIVQKRFGNDADHRAAFEIERDLFYAASRMTDPEERRRTLDAALAKMRERRQRFLSGDHRRFAELEDVFLMMEGTANWAAVQDVMRNVPKEEAIARVRGTGRWWTQDEGLGIFLAIDAALPEWQSTVFSADPPTLEELIAHAVKK